MVEKNLTSFYKGKKILITGDTGFKGSWLVICLLLMGADVVGFSLDPKTDNDNYVVCCLKKHFQHINGDIRDHNKLLNIIKDYKPEIVFHLAAQALVIDSYKNPLETFDTNVMGTINLFEAVRLTDSVKAFVNVTSDKCYLNKEWIYPYKEIDELGGKDPYSASKAVSEIVTQSYIHSFFGENSPVNLGSVRSGNVIGGGDWSDNRLVPDCIKSIQKNETIIIRNPLSTRPWQYVLEPLYGYLLLAQKLFMGDKFYSSPWNFGPSTKNMITVKNIVEKIINFSNKGSYEIINNEGFFSEAKLLHLDTSKALKYLNWSSILDIDESIDLTVGDYDIYNKSSDQILEERKKRINDYINKQSKIS